MSAPLRVALVGAGYFARFHLDAWCRLDGVRLVAVCDADEARARAFAAEANAFGGDVKALTCIEVLLDTTPLDIIDLATPPPTHLRMVGLAAGRVDTIVCQKPLAPTYAEAVEVVEAARSGGSALVVHENFRFSPWYREMRRCIDMGMLGKLHSVAMRLRPGDGQGADAYLDRQPYFQKMERFLVHETAIHLIDVFRYLCGEVSGVFARLRKLNPAIAGEDAGCIVFDFDGGASGLFDGNRLNDHPADNTRLTMGECWLEGSAGVLRLDGFGRLHFKPHGAAEHEHAYAWSRVGFAGDAVYNLCAHVAKCVSTGMPFENTGADYLRNLEIEEAVYASAADGRYRALKVIGVGPA